MTTLLIKDLPDTIQLDRESLAKIYGGWSGLMWGGYTTTTGSGTTSSGGGVLSCARGEHLKEATF